jgi:exopolysaccharide biosynthesis polyprenyl glycosylphosphotransferase
MGISDPVLGLGREPFGGRGTHPAAAQAAQAERARGNPPLRRILVGVDLLAIAVGWAASLAVLALVGTTVPTTMALSHGLVLLIVGAMLLSANGLYRRRICAIRSAELARLGRTSVLLAVVASLLLLGTGVRSAHLAAAGGAAVWFAVLAIERGLLREWIHGRRATGDFGAPVVVVGGSGESTLRAAEFLADNPVLGFQVRGVVSPTSVNGQAARFGWSGTDLVEQTAKLGATGVVLDANSLTGDELNEVVHELSTANLHVHISSGLRGIDRRRITVSPMADETFLHVTPPALSRPQVVIKRVVDVVLGSLALAVFTPALLVCALVIWAYDRGPILFRQERVGHQGERFTLYKLRTMVVDADERLAELQDRNGRAGGPLFKLSRDPRVTPFGRFLRASSLDEVPQLFNVLEGTMSLVGPRPALPAEVAQFDERLNARLTVKPGVTGLWQVEARDLPSFDLYRRFDLLYVQNWSLALDLAIVARTVTVVLVRAVAAVLPARLTRRSTILE